MLYRLEKLIGMTLEASDGEIGSVTDIYFDDHRWTVRYLVVDTGGWLGARDVLIPVPAIEVTQWDNRMITVRLTREQVRNSPDIDTQKPVYRQHETELFNYYGYPAYWASPVLGIAMPYAVAPLTALTPIPPLSHARELPAGAEADANLRSVKEIVGYHIEASDNGIGHLEDFLVESDGWMIRYLVVDTRNWWPGKHVVIPPQWVTTVEWAERMVHVDVSRETVKQSPEFHPETEFSRSHEAALFEHYQRLNYWS